MLFGEKRVDSIMMLSASSWPLFSAGSFKLKSMPYFNLLSTVKQLNMAHNLFSPILVGSIFLKNRIVMAPLTRCRAGPSHLPNDLMKEHYTQRASAGLYCLPRLPATDTFDKASIFDTG
ncbi:hypothetical protein LEN26_009761 [Aphanomyces euteiches]|nr:hypothetical protein AeMF1_007047 [Aphanomyces euteiches]KAH9124189.1 hypothetical protein LEN26_009761 [Aphanomyces euteiches]